MLKFIDADIVFQEVPDEVSLALGISGCPNRCPACHSKYLWEDTGNVLNESVIDSYLDHYKSGITCICFMGGDNDKQEVYRLAAHVKSKYPQIKTAWYTGSNEIDNDFPWCDFDYVKVGRYIESRGPLSNPGSNQYMLRKKEDGRWEDITHKFYEAKHVI